MSEKGNKYVKYGHTIENKFNNLKTATTVMNINKCKIDYQKMIS